MQWTHVSSVIIGYCEKRLFNMTMRGANTTTVFKIIMWLCTSNHSTHKLQSVQVPRHWFSSFHFFLCCFYWTPKLETEDFPMMREYHCGKITIAVIVSLYLHCLTSTVVHLSFYVFVLQWVWYFVTVGLFAPQHPQLTKIIRDSHSAKSCAYKNNIGLIYFSTITARINLEYKSSVRNSNTLIGVRKGTEQLFAKLCILFVKFKLWETHKAKANKLALTKI